VASLYLSFKCKIKYSTRIDLPVPPMDKLPTPMLNMLNFLEAKTPILKKRFLMKIIRPYKMEKGKRRKRRFFIT